MPPDLLRDLDAFGDDPEALRLLSCNSPAHRRTAHPAGLAARLARLPANGSTRSTQPMNGRRGRPSPPGQTTKRSTRSWCQRPGPYGKMIV